MSALNKTILREIKGTFGRFISILILIAVGVFAYVGISVTGSNMRMTGIDYSNEHNLADIYIQSSFGLDEKDQKTLANFKELTKIEYGYSVDATMVKDRTNKSTTEEQLVIKIESLPETLSTYEIVSGKLPQNNQEIVLDQKLALLKGYAIGDTVEFIQSHDEDKSLDNLKSIKYKVVGFVNSPEYLTKIERGQSLTGKGEIFAFASILPQDFDMEYYTIARAKSNVINESNTDKTVYDDKIITNIDNVKDQIVKADLATIKLNALKQEIEEQLNDAETKVFEGKKELKENEQKLSDAEKELADAKTKYNSGYNELVTQVAEQKNLLESSEQQLLSAKTILDNAKLELDNASLSIEQGKDALSTGKNEWSAKNSLYLEQLDNWESQYAIYIQARTELTNTINVWQQKQNDLNERIAQIGLTPELQAEQDLLDAEKTILDQQEALLNATEIRLNNAKQQLDNAKLQLDEGKRILDIKEAELNRGIDEYNNGFALYQENLQVYESSKAKIESGWQLLAEAESLGVAELAAAAQLISEGEAQLNEGFTLFNQEKEKAEKEIADAEKEIKDTRKSIADLKAPTYFVKGRNGLFGYDQFFDNGSRLDVLAYIFPVFLFFVAALVTLTTMTRMVEEQRTQIGTLKALGYTRKDIMRKYILYGILSGGLGTIIGTIFGLNFLPQLIYSAYKSAYIFSDLMTKFYPFYVVIGVIIAIICTILPVIYSVSSSLKEKTTELMRPKAPKIGKRILLERITFIWKRLSFNYKVTARNLFRYKQRMLMTVVGVAGCVALIITGIGIRDSLRQTIQVQLDELYLYDVLASYNPDADVNDLQIYENVISTNEEIANKTKVLNDTVEISKTGKANEELTFIVPQYPQELNDFIAIKDGKDRLMVADNTGAIISQKIAELYDVKVGDEITIVQDENEYLVKIAKINQWYMGNQLVMSPEYYQEIFGNAPNYNTYLIKAKDSNDLVSITDVLNEQKANTLALRLGSTTDIIKESMDGLNLVMIVLLLLAIMLAIVVLYNLTNINISERIRELSTIKVLGFYPKEVTLYIYRETLFLTFLGIIFGWILGTMLEQFIIIQIPPGMVMFYRKIFWTNYLISAVVTYMISFVIMFIMHRKLKKVDMIEALKSIE